MDPALRAVLDRQEIVDASNRYATALDTRDWALLRSCFVPDAVGQYDTVGNLEGYVVTHEGCDAIEVLCQAALTPLDASQDLLGNHVVEIAGDEGTVTLYFQAQHVRSSAPCRAAATTSSPGGTSIESSAPPRAGRSFTCTSQPTGSRRTLQC